MNEIFLNIKALKKTYKIKPHPFSLKALKLKAVDEVSFEIKKGEILGVVGESGCGKSTLGRLLLLLERPDYGEIWWDNKCLTRLKSKEIKKIRPLFQPIFQDPFSSLNPKLSVYRILEEPLIIHKFGNKKERERRINKFLFEVGLSPQFKYAYPHELSGGQRQRIAIARALILEPDFIVADEPTSALDVSVQAQIVNLLLDIQKKRRITYFFITHNLNLIAQIADRILVMYLGKIFEIMERKDFKGKHHPYTEILWGSIPTLRKKEKKKLFGEPPHPSFLPKGCLFHPRCPYCMDICKEKMPILKEIESGHKIACHLF
ncbi:MAG TPA: ATP-binding cassette domain-containing protein [Candidatus Desulfofervidus auxilii]|uniref:ATP-binding cassette domain-containing protein n=1 Tax=Desulfofervidus auxilii TaxID=1621989 RepID=A0A7V0I9N0_DESA2|nr:ATP-binding cassette domain-containing protein [Candidatus Desulfofervidus auxilii]